MRLWCFGSQKQLDVESFGPNLADVEKQIAAHNILHQAIQSYSTQLTPDSTASPVRARVGITDGLGSDLSAGSMFYHTWHVQKELFPSYFLEV